MRSGTTGGRGPETKEVEEQEAGRPWEDSGRALLPERPRPGDQPEGDAPRAPEILLPPLDSRDQSRNPRAAPGSAGRANGRASVSPPWLRFGREGAGGPRAGRESGSVRRWQRQRVALIRLIRPDGSRSPKHGFCVFSFLSWLVSLIGVTRRVWAAA